jgi:cytidylate kinase
MGTKKPIVQIKIEGPETSGKSMTATSIAKFLAEVLDYKIQSPASSYDAADSYQLEDDYHIIQIRTKRTL